MRPPRLSELLLSIGHTPEGDDRGTNFIRTDNGLRLKQRPEQSKAHQEYLATQLARMLLPRQLAVPVMWGWESGGLGVGDWFISDEIDPAEFRKFDKNRTTDCIAGARYMAQMHKRVLQEKTRNELFVAGFCHYAADALGNRLEQEARFGREAFGSGGLAERLEAVVKTAVRRLPQWKQEVLGHGDFQASNLFVSDNDSIVLPIDWTDFGVCCRAYEVAHFLYSIAAENRPPALDTYIKDGGFSGSRDHLVMAGEVLDAIIRAGSAARGVNADTPAERQVRAQDRFRDQVERAEEALRVVGIDQ
jgi:hypothetical protein